MRTRQAFPFLVSLFAVRAFAMPPTLPAWSFEGFAADAKLGTMLSAVGDIDGDGFGDLISCRAGVPALYRGAPQGPALDSSWTPTAVSYCVPARLGDVNGDSFDDVAVGAAVYHGSANGLPSTPSWVAHCNQSDAWFGSQVVGPGDLDGDGYPDIVIGAPNYAISSMQHGRVFVYYGSESGLLETPGWTIDGPGSPTLTFPDSIRAAGDVNGDQLGEFLLETSLVDSLSHTSVGRTGLYCGSFGGPGECWGAQAIGHSPVAGEMKAAPIGDVNGDGYDDLMYSFHGDEQPTWATRIAYGSAAGLQAGVAWGSDGSAPPLRIAAGDVNGDGFEDLLTALPAFAVGTYGEVSIRLGSAAGLGENPAWTVAGNQSAAGFGAYVAAKCEVNGDVKTDVCLGAPNWTDHAALEGAIFIYSEGRDGDGDGVPDLGDCAPENASASSLPGEATALRVRLAAEGTVLEWAGASAAASYDVVSGPLDHVLSYGGIQGAACLAGGLAALSTTDTSVNPATGDATYYLVRGSNVCGHGLYAAAALGQPHFDCP